MIKIDPTLLIIIAEVVVGLVVILGAALLFFIKRRKADKQAVAELQARLKGNSGKRQEMFEEVLAKTGGDEEDSEEMLAEKKGTAKEWVDKENDFYNRLVEMYMQRNSSALKSLDKLMHEYTSSYLDVVSLMRERVDVEQTVLSDELAQQLARMEADGKKLISEIDSLKGENQRLSTELEKANAEIDQAMHEYSRMAVTGAANKKVATVSKTEPIKEAVAPVSGVETENDAEVVVDELAVEPEAGLDTLAKADSEEPVSDPLSELEAELQTEMESVVPEMVAEQAAEQVEASADDELVDMSMLDDFGVETTAVDNLDELIEAAESKTVEISDEVSEVAEPEAVEVPGEVIEVAEPEAVEVADEVTVVAEPEAVEVPDEVIEVAEPEAVEVADEVIEVAEPEAVEVADEVIEVAEPEAVEIPEEIKPEEESLEDVVLHAMAEESAAQKAEADAALEVDEENPAKVIDLAKDDDIVLSAFAENVDESDVDQMPETQAGDGSVIDEDYLLAQLAEIEDSDEFGSLEGFGEAAEPVEDEAKKPAS